MVLNRWPSPVQNFFTLRGACPDPDAVDEAAALEELSEELDDLRDELLYQEMLALARCEQLPTIEGATMKTTTKSEPGANFDIWAHALATELKANDDPRDPDRSAVVVGSPQPGHPRTSHLRPDRIGPTRHPRGAVAQVESPVHD